VRKHKPTQAPAASNAPADQQTSKATLMAAAFIFLLVDFVVVLLLVSLAQEMGKEQTTQPPTANNAPADQQTSKATLMAAALVLFLADVVVIVLLLVPLAQEMGKECATQAPTAYHATTDQKAGDPTFV
jgi:ABC-type Fe3+ transport system permease subunit